MSYYPKSGMNVQGANGTADAAVILVDTVAHEASMLQARIRRRSVSLGTHWHAPTFLLQCLGCTTAPRDLGRIG
jgi:hypothetical protein